MTNKPFPLRSAALKGAAFGLMFKLAISIAVCTTLYSLTLRPAIADKVKLLTHSNPDIEERLRLHSKNVKIEKIIASDILLSDSKEPITFTEIYIPYFEKDKDKELTPFESSVLDYLSKEVKGQSAALYVTKFKNAEIHNSLDHLMAHIIRKDGLWIEGDMVAKGLAYAYPTKNHHDMKDYLLKIEDIARKEKLGLWKEEDNMVRPHERAEELIGRFGLVEGKIRSVSSRENFIYLNFGRDWRTDFTIRVQAKDRTYFARENINVMQLAHKPIRIRGWVESYNGPMITLVHPHQLEFLEDNALADKTESDEDTAEAGGADGAE